jgi:hypothetical protein
MQSLHEIAANYVQALEKIDAGDMDFDNVMDVLQGIGGLLEEKATELAKVVQNYEANAQAITEAIERMVWRRDRIRARAERLEEYIQSQLQLAQVTRIESPWFEIRVRQNPASVVIEEGATLPADYLRQPATPPPQADKVAIKRAIEAGLEVPGCKLVRTTRLEIR